MDGYRVDGAVLLVGWPFVLPKQLCVCGPVPHTPGSLFCCYGFSLFSGLSGCKDVVSLFLNPKKGLFKPLVGPEAPAEECGFTALELNDYRGPLECPQSPPPSASPVSLLCGGNRWPQLSPAGLKHIVTPS